MVVGAFDSLRSSSLKHTTMSDFYNAKDEVGHITYNDEKFEVKWYGGFLFATEKLSDVLMDDNTGLAVSDDADLLDEKIAYYFDVEDFEGKDGKELYDAYMDDFVSFK